MSPPPGRQDPEPAPPAGVPPERVAAVLWTIVCVVGWTLWLAATARSTAGACCGFGGIAVAGGAWLLGLAVIAVAAAVLRALFAR